MILETERLRLRRMTIEDVDDLLGIMADPEAMRFYPAVRDRAGTEQWVQWTLECYQRDGIGLWIAEVKASGAFAGQCGLVVQEVEGRREVEIGYLFLRHLWNQGLATEAARAWRDYAFSQLGLQRVISLIAPDNWPSRRVAEKVGMRLEREIRKWDRPICLYALNRR